MPSWLWLLLPLVASAALRDLWAPDEPRYAEVARELFESGDLLVMRLCGSVYPDKPPLFFWLAGALGHLSAWSVPVMRGVSLLAVAGTALLIAQLARRWWGEEASRWAPALWLSTAMLAEIGGRLQIDPLLTLLATAAAVLASEPASDPRAAGRRVLLAGALAGLGVLAKGPVALVIVGLTLGAWRLLGPLAPGPRAGRGAWLGALALALVLPAAWAAAAIQAEPELARHLLFGQHLERVTGAEPPHAGAPWKHLLRMPVLLLPWTAAVLLGLGDALRAWRARRAGAEHDRGVLLAAAWLLALFAFFSLIPPKRDLYLLPAYPAAALLGARALSVRLRARAPLGPILLPAAATLGLVGALLVALGPLASLRPPEGLDAAAPELLLRTSAAGLPWLLGSLWILRSQVRHGAATALRRTLFVWTGGLTVALVALLPLIDPLKSARGLALEIAARSERPTEIPCVGVQPEGYRFYGGVPTVRAVSLEPWLAREGDAFLGLISEGRWERLGESARERFQVLRVERVGSRRVHLVGASLATGQDHAQAGAAGGGDFDPDLAALGSRGGAGQGQAQPVADAPPGGGR